MDPAPIAAVDLGSNTVRLLVATAASNGPRRLFLLQEVTRLGEGLQPGGSLLPQAVNRTLKVLHRFRREAAAWPVKRTLLGATMAVRQAVDGPEFLKRVEQELGIATLVLTGTQEAELSAAGAMTALDPVPETTVIFDLGGRSTEFILVEKGRFRQVRSLELGVVALTEAHLLSDPPTRAEIVSCRRAAAMALDRELAGIFKPRPGSSFGLVGTAGTTTTLAAMAQGLAEYDPDLIDNYRLAQDRLKELYNQMLPLPIIARAQLPGLPADRADIIVAGAAVVLEVMEYFRTRHLIVSDKGLLEGIWLAAAGLRSIE